MALRPIVELGVDEAHAILIEHFRQSGLPPRAAVDNEDWGRDYLLAKLAELSPAALARAGLTLDDDAGD